MTDAELRNLVDVPHAQRQWLRHQLLDKGIMVHDPCTACNLLCSDPLLTALLLHLHLLHGIYIGTYIAFSFISQLLQAA
jgi:hypothetical protein